MSERRRSVSDRAKMWEDKTESQNANGTTPKSPPSSQGGGAARRFSNTAPKCKECGKSAYAQESIVYDKQTWHKTCFKCKNCSSKVSIKAVAMLKGELYCKPCFMKMFKEKGSYQVFDDDTVTEKPPAKEHVRVISVHDPEFEVVVESEEVDVDLSQPEISILDEDDADADPEASADEVDDVDLTDPARVEADTEIEQETTKFEGVRKLSVKDFLRKSDPDLARLIEEKKTKDSDNEEEAPAEAVPAEEAPAEAAPAEATPAEAAPAEAAPAEAAPAEERPRRPSIKDMTAMWESKSAAADNSQDDEVQSNIQDDAESTDILQEEVNDSDAEGVHADTVEPFENDTTASKLHVTDDLVKQEHRPSLLDIQQFAKDKEAERQELLKNTHFVDPDDESEEMEAEEQQAETKAPEPEPVPAGNPQSKNVHKRRPTDAHIDDENAPWVTAEPQNDDEPQPQSSKPEEPREIVTPEKQKSTQEDTRLCTLGEYEFHCSVQ